MIYVRTCFSSPELRGKSQNTKNNEPMKTSRQTLRETLTMLTILALVPTAVIAYECTVVDVQTLTTEHNCPTNPCWHRDWDPGVLYCTSISTCTGKKCVYNGVYTLSFKEYTNGNGSSCISLGYCLGGTLVSEGEWDDVAKPETANCTQQEIEEECPVFE